MGSITRVVALCLVLAASACREREGGPPVSAAVSPVESPDGRTLTVSVYLLDQAAQHTKADGTVTVVISQGEQHKSVFSQAVTREMFSKVESGPFVRVSGPLDPPCRALPSGSTAEGVVTFVAADGKRMEVALDSTSLPMACRPQQAPQQPGKSLAEREAEARAALDESIRELAALAPLVPDPTTITSDAMCPQDVIEPARQKGSNPLMIEHGLIKTFAEAVRTGGPAPQPAPVGRSYDLAFLNHGIMLELGSYARGAEVDVLDLHETLALEKRPLVTVVSVQRYVRPTHVEGHGPAGPSTGLFGSGLVDGVVFVVDHRRSRTICHARFAAESSELVRNRPGQTMQEAHREDIESRGIDAVNAALTRIAPTLFIDP